jgi:hypothetical protein
MAQITVEELRIHAALANPNFTSTEVRREADRVLSVLEGIEAEDNLRAAFAAQQAEQEAQQAVEAQRRAEAYADARAIVAKSHPGYDAAGIEYAAQKLVAENEAGIAALTLKEALAE